MLDEHPNEKPTELALIRILPVFVAILELNEFQCRSEYSPNIFQLVSTKFSFCFLLSSLSFFNCQSVMVSPRMFRTHSLLEHDIPYHFIGGISVNMYLCFCTWITLKIRVCLFAWEGISVPFYLFFFLYCSTLWQWLHTFLFISANPNRSDCIRRSLSF